MCTQRLACGFWGILCYTGRVERNRWWVDQGDQFLLWAATALFCPREHGKRGEPRNWGRAGSLQRGQRGLRHAGSAPPTGGPDTLPPCPRPRSPSRPGALRTTQRPRRGGPGRAWRRSVPPGPRPRLDALRGRQGQRGTAHLPPAVAPAHWLLARARPPHAAPIGWALPCGAAVGRRVCQSGAPRPLRSVPPLGRPGPRPRRLRRAGGSVRGRCCGSLPAGGVSVAAKALGRRPGQPSPGQVRRSRAPRPFRGRWGAAGPFSLARGSRTLPAPPPPARCCQPRLRPVQRAELCGAGPGRAPTLPGLAACGRPLLPRAPKGRRGARAGVRAGGLRAATSPLAAGPFLGDASPARGSSFAGPSVRASECRSPALSGGAQGPSYRCGAGAA